MTQKQALTISIIAGLVMLTFVVLIMLLVVPPGELLPTTPTATPTPRPTPTPTFPNFMPTPSFETPLPPEPTPTNTPVLAGTPPPSPSPTPTEDIDLSVLTPFVKPTATLTPTLAPTPTSVPPTATLPPVRQYTISFSADDTTLEEDECTDLRWNVQGQVVLVQLNGQPVTATGVREVCPGDDTTYTLSTQLVGSARVERRTVTIAVE